ncbi:DUF2975 domain-containing protein [Halpernia frigidisoli]|uniref:DUF2975 domain-containing protein n=1 Tax=Halpernia frigidisoli TaxID=1125876 RepID=A0A1I3DK23_9FLAO|nr:DUF2975 domain-containing protein [Halpernia frigidisoli]SFH86888.1 Protein of unknown function [Halpernia frigidisoli]
MKITGTNSLAKYLSYFAFFIFAFCAVHLVYELVGHAVLYYKHQSGSQIFPNTFILNKNVGWTRNKWTIPMDQLLKFKINYPFSSVQVVTGVYGSSQIIYNSLAFLFLSLFFFLSYKTLKEMSTDKIFNPNAIKWLKHFAYFNLIVAILFILYTVFFHSIDISIIFQIFFSGFLGIMILFVVDFFKKGYQLQNENDLTI